MKFELAPDANQATDIILSGHEYIGDWASANLILPVTDKIPSHPEFGDIILSLCRVLGESKTLILSSGIISMR